MTISDKRNIERLFWEEHYSYAVIGKVYGVSRQRIEQIIKESKKYSYTSSKIPTCVMCGREIETIPFYFDGDETNKKRNNVFQMCRDHYNKRKKL